jgi:undecaprenyl-diphosphatase
MSHWEAIVLGLIQGLTEFLPVSSSGHLELGKSLFGLAEVDLTFSILVHGATACSTLVVFRNDIAQLITGTFTSDLDRRTTSRNYIFWIAVSVIPAVLVAFTMRHALEDFFINHPNRVGWSLCATAVILFASERLKPKKQNISLKTGLLIGCAQAFAIVPGISRSGSTIGAAIALGISREEAARFSFLMALPVIFGATALELLDLYKDGIGQGASVSWKSYALGAAAAFTSGWVACQWMIRFVKRTKMHTFAVYCLIVGVLASILLA